MLQLRIFNLTFFGLTITIELTFLGSENESPFSINQFLNPLLFIRILKVLEHMALSNRGHFDYCTLCWDGPTMKYTARHYSSFGNFDSP
jgi:hypothetical protein